MLEMTLNDIEKSYLEAKDKKSQIGILADLNGVESTFMGCFCEKWEMMLTR